MKRTAGPGGASLLPGPLNRKEWMMDFTDYNRRQSRARLWLNIDRAMCWAGKAAVCVGIVAAAWGIW